MAHHRTQRAKPAAPLPVPCRVLFHRAGHRLTEYVPALGREVRWGLAVGTTRKSGGGGGWRRKTIFGKFGSKFSAKKYRFPTKRFKYFWFKSILSSKFVTWENDGPSVPAKLGTQEGLRGASASTSGPHPCFSACAPLSGTQGDEFSRCSFMVFVVNPP